MEDEMEEEDDDGWMMIGRFDNVMIKSRMRS